MALVFVAVLALALAAMSDRTVRSFESQPKIMTVALAPALNATDEAAKTAAVLAYLKGIPGVAFADPVSEQELGMLVEPWLGDDQAAGKLPLPRLIDVGFNPGVEPDVGVIDDELKLLAPGASIGYGGMESDESEALARLVRVLSLVVGVGAFVVIIFVSAVITRMSLDLHDETVDLLRMMGAGDRYVARQFEQHALYNALRGALLGFAGAIGVLLVMIWLGDTWMSHIFTIQLRPLDWVLLSMTPVLATVMTAYVAKKTAGWSLTRLP